MSDSTAYVIYGFDIGVDGLLPEHLDDDAYLDLQNSWEDRLAAEAGHPRPPGRFSDERREEFIAFHATRKMEASRAPTIIAWGTDGYGLAVGFELGSGNSEVPTPLDPLVVPEDAEARIAALCEHLGIEPQPCSVLLLVSVD
jgi:hypothetical protein